MIFSRKQLLSLSGLTVAARLIEPMRNDAVETVVDAVLQERIERLLRDYDQQGIHRTGTDGDRKSAEWLAAKVREYGVRPALNSFPHDRVDPRLCLIESSGSLARSCGCSGYRPLRHGNVEAGDDVGKRLRRESRRRRGYVWLRTDDSVRPD